MRSVRLSLKHARLALAALDRMTGESGVFVDAYEALRAALKPKPVSSARQKTKARRETRKEETARIRDVVFRRAGGWCEFWCGQRAEDLHHAFGRVRVRQSERNCLALCRPCHHALTNNVGGAANWWAKVAQTFERLGCEPERDRAARNADFAIAKGAARAD